MSGDGRTEATEVARASGLIEAGRPLLVMVSGGADSTCLLDVAVALAAEVTALHVNYGLRGEESDADERACRELCERLGVELHVERVALDDAGNLHDRARGARYAVARRLARGDFATAHNASDQAETILYRLATSPGRGALLGMAPRRDRLVRPLLEATAEQTRAHCTARRLTWREDRSNSDRRFARARVREEALPALRSVGPAVDRTLVETARQLREEQAVLDAAVDEALAGLGGGPAVELSALRRLPAALARLVLRRLGETAAGASRALSRDELERILGLGPQGSQTLELGGGLHAVCEYGWLRFEAGERSAPPEPVELAVPGEVRFGDWIVGASADGRGEVAITAALPGRLTVRCWCAGDRIRPRGLDGSKTLQDLFTDCKVPRALRRSLPVIVCGEEIVWVAGLAIAERFSATEAREGRERTWLSARYAPSGGDPAPAGR